MDSFPTCSPPRRGRALEGWKHSHPLGAPHRRAGAPGSTATCGGIGLDHSGFLGSKRADLGDADPELRPAPFSAHPDGSGVKRPGCLPSARAAPSPPGRVRQRRPPLPVRLFRLPRGRRRLPHAPHDIHGQIQAAMDGFKRASNCRLLASPRGPTSSLQGERAGGGRRSLWLPLPPALPFPLSMGLGPAWHAWQAVPSRAGPARKTAQ